MYQILAFTAFCLMVGASQATASPCSTSEVKYAILDAKKERDHIIANFKERDVADSVDRFQMLLRKCDIPLSNFGIGDGALDFWKTQGYEAAYKDAKDRLEYNSQFRTDPSAAGDVKKYGEKLQLNSREVERYIENYWAKGSTSLTKEKASCQPIVDLRDNRLGPVRDQDSVGWCYSFVAADLLSFKLGKKISAADVAVSNNDTWTNAILKKFGRSEVDIERGFPEDAIEGTKSKGWCLESKFSSEDNSNWDLKTLIEQTEAIKKKFPNEAAGGNSNCGQALLLFGGLNLQSLMQTVERSSRSSLIPALADRACSPRIKNLDVQVVSDSVTYSSDKSPLFKMIDGQLNNKNIAGIGYEVAVLTNRNYKEGLGAHSGIIVGRKFNSQTNECEYLIRNSWGRGCSLYDSSYKCEEGNIWVPKAALYKGIMVVRYIP